MRPSAAARAIVPLDPATRALVRLSAAIAGRLATGATPGERVRLAIIGVRSRGTDLAQSFAKNENAEVVAVCDIDDAMLEKPVKAVEDWGLPTEPYVFVVNGQGKVVDKFEGTLTVDELVAAARQAQTP